MEELKRMLEVIDKENKDILKLLCINDANDMTKEGFGEISDVVNKKYDVLFYGKEVTNESTN